MIVGIFFSWSFFWNSDNIVFYFVQLSSAGIVCLPKFEMVMAKSEANSKPVLAAEDVYIATM
jgi:hypothetical protein